MKIYQVNTLQQFYITYFVRADNREAAEDIVRQSPNTLYEANQRVLSEQVVSSRKISLKGVRRFAEENDVYLHGDEDFSDLIYDPDGFDADADEDDFPSYVSTYDNNMASTGAKAFDDIVTTVTKTQTVVPKFGASSLGAGSPKFGI